MLDKLELLMKWLPQNTKIKVLSKMPTSWIEENFHRLNIQLKDIFYKKTWSLEFLTDILPKDETDLWDYISQFYTLDEEFCEKNIDFLNFHNLYEFQNLPRMFYFQHKTKIDWIPKTIEITKENIFKVPYHWGRTWSSPIPPLLFF